MAPVLRRIDDYWDWRLSARLRIASLASAWALVLLMPVLGWLALPLAGARSGASFVQSGLNIRLGRQVPVGRPDRMDWGLIGSIFAMAYMAAGVSYATGMSHYSPALVLPLLVPFSVLQVRMVRRSWVAQASVDARPAAVVRMEEWQRGELREVGDVRELERAA